MGISAILIMCWLITNRIEQRQCSHPERSDENRKQQSKGTMKI
jgi:hypothetical protein